MIIDGTVDALFDIIVTIAYINTITEVTDNLDILVFGTVIGFGQQMFGILMLLLWSRKYEEEGCVLVLSMIEYVGALIEISIMISVVALVTGDTVFVVLSIIVLSVPGLFLCLQCFLSAMQYLCCVVMGIKIEG